MQFRDDIERQLWATVVSAFVRPHEHNADGCSGCLCHFESPRDGECRYVICVLPRGHLGDHDARYEWTVPGEWKEPPVRRFSCPSWQARQAADREVEALRASSVAIGAQRRESSRGDTREPRR